jgi:hypothetical protein
VGNPHLRFDEGRVRRSHRLSLTLLLYRLRNVMAHLHALTEPRPSKSGGLPGFLRCGCRQSSGRLELFLLTINRKEDAKVRFYKLLALRNTHPVPQH